MEKIENTSLSLSSVYNSPRNSRPLDVKVSVNNCKDTKKSTNENKEKLFFLKKTSKKPSRRTI
ncbi:MAG: hypothetical protein J1F13_04085 [Prevotellaceae bacterium]|nr:hypothetical protein [Prevotellaceae bacterium]